MLEQPIGKAGEVRGKADWGVGRVERGQACRLASLRKRVEPGSGTYVQS